MGWRKNSEQNDLKTKLEKEKEQMMEKIQVEALEKQKKRNATMGELLRSKGFLWLATSNDLIGKPVF